jgi:phosphatidylserine decarboxylase
MRSARTSPASCGPNLLGPVTHVFELARAAVPPMHPAGRPFVAGAAAVSLLLRRDSRGAGLAGWVATAGIALFFREPRRVAPDRTGVAVAPADGTVSDVSPAAAPPELGLGGEPRPRVSVFLSVFDPPVQRAPADGEVREVVYRPGKFLCADLDKASEANERNSLLLRTAEGHELVVAQIAGLVARRIVCSARPGDSLAAGETYGLIRFGSRVDLYLPPGSRVLVREGQRSVGGETVVGELPPGPGG